MKEVSIISKVVSRGKAEALPSASASMPNWAELAKYVTIDGDETIHGVKDFANGLMIGGLPLIKLQDDVVYLDAHLVVRGGITMFGTGEDVDVPTIMDALSVDGVNLQVINGVLTFVGEATGGVADSVRWENVIGRPTLLSSFTDDVVAGKYLPLNTSTTNILTSSQPGVLNFKSTSSSEVGIRLYFNETNGGGLWYNGVQGMYLYNTASATQLGLLNNGTPYYQDLTYNKRHLWHSGNFNPNNYLPLTGGVIKGSSDTPLQIKSPLVGFVGLNLFTDETLALHLGYWDKLGGVRFENLRNQSKSGIGVLDNGLVVQYSYDDNYNFTKNKIWHEGNHGSGSGLSADMLDGYHEYDFYRSYREGINATNVNTFVNTKYTGTYSINHNGQYSGLLLSFNRGQGSVSSIELIAPHYDFHIYGLQARIAIDNNRYSALRTFAFTDSNVASATKLQTARTIWGQSFDGTGNVSGTLYTDLIRTTDNTWVYGWGDGKVMSFGSTTGCNETSIHGQNVVLKSYSSTTQKGELMLNSSGDVGIGTSSPQAKLSVQGGIDTYRSSGDYSGAIGFNRKSAVGGLYISSYHGHQIHNYKGDLQFYIEKTDKTWLHSLVIQGSTGNVGIGTIAPSCSLHVVGDILSTGGITMYSDQRKKTILNHVELSLKQIADAPLIEHYYNSDESKTTHVGSIAQYWAEMNDWFCKLDNEGFYTMEIQNAALASAISIARELQKYESKTDKKIRLLKKRIGELEDKIEELEKKGA